MQPPIHVARYFKDFTVTLTMPDGTTDIVKTDSYRGDGTGWFEYVVNQVGTWKIKFAFIGAYYPAGNYSVLEGAFMAPQVVSFSGSCYYKPSSTAEYEFVVQQDWRLLGPHHRFQLTTGHDLCHPRTESGAEIVSRDAVESLLYYLEERSKQLTAAALKFAKHAKRKKITASDIQLAIDYYM
jgi:hypothetical protein